jgi:O-antigen ligase
MRRREIATAAVGAVALAVSIFALGGAPRWAQAIVAALGAIAIASHLASRRVFERVPPLVVVLALAAGLTALQLVPVPGAIAERLDPVGSVLRADGAAILGTAPSSALTHDVPGSLRGLAYFLILLAVAIVVLRMASTERGRYRVQAAIAIACGLGAIVVGVHALFDLTKLYGVYTPHAQPRVLGPLLNGNHMGCLMAIGAVVACGLAMYGRQPAWARVGWLAIVAGCGSAALADWSRGAALALGAGLVVVAAVLLGQRVVGEATARKRRASLTSSLPIGIVAACTVVVVLYASAGGVTEQLKRTHLEELHAPGSKFAAWRSALALIKETPWVGVGRGGFEPTFTRVHPASAFGTFSHLENEYVQTVVDFGVPGAILIGLAGAWLAMFAIRRWRDGPLAAGALGALAVVALQSNVDFGVELLGVAVPITAICATLTYVQLREPLGRRRLAVSRAFGAGHAVALGACALILMSSASTSLAEDHERIADRTVGADEIRAELDRHPFDYYGFARLAELMVRDRDKRAINVLNHALVLHPTNSGLHEAAAELLYAAGHSLSRPDIVEQSTIEYAQAIRGTVDKSRLVRAVAQRFPPPLAAAAIPTDVPSIDAIIKTLDDAHHPDVAIAWLGRVLDVRPNDLHACETLYDLAIHRGDPALADVAHRRCPEYEPGEDTRLALAQILFDKHAYAAVGTTLADVERWTGRIDRIVTGWLLACDALIAQSRWDEAKRCLHRLDASGDLPRQRAAEITSRLEKIQQDRRATGLAKP